ncbi:pentraxin-4 [Neomonachus schauinslandi]|uniref:Pentraxin-4 n=1 Tax=Neomonachus schauinslandi TaxID=29088 RepID=A0A2Y9HPJ5_NEOSC|nr:pentraxin-4 [Neomonachus schauinslandi]
MGCPRRKALSLLIFVPACLHGALSQGYSPAGQRKPFLERLRRLEGQFRRLQEVTLTHLRVLARNYNLSYGIDARFQSLVRKTQAVALAVNQSQAAMQGDLSHLKTWMQKTQRRSRKVESRLLALGAALSERGKQRTQEGKEPQVQRGALSGLAPDLRALQDTLAHLTHLVQGQGTRLAALKGRLQVACPGTMAPGLTPARPPTPPGLPSSSSPTLQRGRQALRPSPETGDPPQDSASGLQGTRALPGWADGAARTHGTLHGQPHSADSATGSEAHAREQCGHSCRRLVLGLTLPLFPARDVGPVLVFPNTSTRNTAFLSPGFPSGLQTLSVCSWVRTASGRLGTLLSYATEENDNKLVLHGRDSLAPGSIHFVIGDPAFRELPPQPLLDGRWHHVCVIWMSTPGRYWLYVDHSLVATGSHFREGYEIPAGGSLVLGQEQDSMGGGFDSSEAFVGSIAGLAIWDQALVPGEVAKLATGREVPGGAILTLDNAQWGGGYVQRVNCSCLELCP